MKPSYEELEARCASLAAENAGLKKYCKDAAFDADYEAELGMERGGFTDALNDINTSATDAFLAEVRAQGLEMFSKAQEKIADEELIGGNFDLSLRFRGMSNAATEFAAQLRKGVQS